MAADITAHYIPERYEAKLQSLNLGGRRRSGPELARAQAIFDKLRADSHLRPLPYKLFIAPLDEANAIAVPGGGVGLSRALLEGVRSDTGLAMVLAHELGHHQHRHTLKSFGRGLLHSLAFAVIFGDSSEVMEIAMAAAESGYSRAQENEADEFGLRLVHSVYGHTDGALEFFEKVRRENAAGESRWASFLASHPYTPDRIERLQELRKTLGKSGWSEN